MPGGRAHRRVRGTRPPGGSRRRISGESFYALSDATPALFWESTANGRITYLSRHWRVMTGRTEKESLGAGWTKWVHPDDLRPSFEALDAARRRRSKFEVEFRVLDRHQEYHILAATVVPRLFRGRVIGFMGSAVDVTAQRTVEQQLRESEDRYRAFVDNSAEGIWRFESAHPVPVTLPVEDQVAHILREGYLAECNPALARVFGYRSPQDVLGASIRHFVKPDNREHMEFLTKFVRSGYTLNDAEVSTTGPTGTMQYLRMSFFGLVKDGALIRAWGSLNDVTERTIAERKLRLLAQTITSARDCISVTDLNDRVLFVNEAFLETYGYGEDELIGKNIDLVRSPKTPPETYHDILAETANKGWYGEIVNRRKDGSEFPIELWTSLVRNDEGEPVAMVGVARDIAMRKKTEEQIRESLHEKEVLLKEVHHRVKNNMQVISSLLNLQSEFIKDDTIVRVLRESQNRVKSMALIHEKLYQSRNLAVIDFGEYVRELSTQIFRSYGMSSSKVTLQVDVESVALAVDRAIPCGIIVNELVSNALKYAFPNGKGGAVTLALRETPQGRVELQIGDNGIGIPEGVEVKTAETLGLSLVRMLTEQIQGELVACHGTPASGSDHGTYFTLSFAK
jgi:PAS domain S-box-containing protein